jgi:secreted trypsin-like serine protease
MKTIIAFAALLCVAAAQELTCGTTPIKPTEEKIVGGHAAIPYSWPWQIQFCIKSSFGGGCSLICGGSIIDATHVLTAAHCVRGQTVSRIGIRAATFKLNGVGENDFVLVNAVKAVFDPRYQNPNQFSNDYAVVTLETPLTFSDRIQPVCLPLNDNGVTVGTRTNVITGWGTTRSGGSLPDRLMQVTVPYVEQADCSAAYPGEIDQSMVCAGLLKEGGKDSCQGDSGGPLVTKATNGRWYEYGVVSWGFGCAVPQKPGVYSRVSGACSFLKDQIGHEICVGGND